MLAIKNFAEKFIDDMDGLYTAESSEQSPPERVISSATKEFIMGTRMYVGRIGELVQKAFGSAPGDRETGENLELPQPTDEIDSFDD